MVLDRIEFDEMNNIRFFIKENDTDYEPYLLKRITPDNWKYSSGEVKLARDGEPYIFNLPELFYHVNLYKEEVFDLYLFKPMMSYKKAVNFGDFEFDKKEFKVSNGLCTLNLTVYKNGTKGCSVRVICTDTDKFRMKLVGDLGDTLELQHSAPENQLPDKIFLARRSTFSHEARYDHFLPLGFSGGKLILPKTAIADLVLTGKETWDFVAECDGQMFTFVTDSEFTCDYFALNDEYSAKIYLSQNSYASIYVKRTGPNEQRKIRVSVLGSCFTRQAFNSAEFMNEDYKKFYEVGLTGFHETFIQLMSSPIPYDKNELFNKPSKFVERYGDRILSNTFLKELKEYAPDYLMIDAYIDSRAQIIPLGDNKYYTNVSFLNETDFYKKLDKSVYYDLNSDERFELFKSAVDAFSEYMQREMPELKIVIVRSYMAVNKVVDGRMVPWDKDKLPFIKYQRLISDRNHDYLISKIKNVKVIDLRDDKYATEKNPYLDFSFNHLSSQYYKDILNMFNKIVLQDILRGDLTIK